MQKAEGGMQNVEGAGRCRDCGGVRRSKASLSSLPSVKPQSPQCRGRERGKAEGTRLRRAFGGQGMKNAEGGSQNLEGDSRNS